MQTGASLKCTPQSEPVAARAEVIFNPVLDDPGIPARGLLGSLFVHLLFAALFFYLPWSYWVPSTARLVTTESMLRKHDVLLLPDLRPASNSGSESTRKVISARPTASSSIAALAVKGVVYQGEQLIISNPPHPDNFVQTIRQPDLPSPPKLPRPLPFPAMISMAPEISLPTTALPQLPTIMDRHIQAPRSPDAVAVHPPLQPPQIDSPKLPLPALQTSNPVTESTAAKAITPPAPQHSISAGAGGSDVRNVIIVDAVEVPARAMLSIPPGELYGAFTVSPAPFASPKAPGAGGSSAAGSTASDAGAVSGSGTGDGAGTTGTHDTTGTGKGRGEGNGATVAGVGHGNEIGTGNGSGHGAGTVSGNGHGNGVASGNSPFPDLTIQGGSRTGNSSRNDSRAQAGSPRQTSYGITIVANGASGGGFKDFGVFRDEASYTVYLDMSDAGVGGSNWTMQYALDSHPAPGTMSLHSHSLLVPPFADSKVLPHFPANAAMRNRGSTLVVFGVITPKGKVEGLRIMQGSDTNLGKLLLEALSQWTFHPAEVEGTPVPVRVLLGVPVNSVPQDATSTGLP